ncbi:MAG: OmpA family protein [Polyangiaceae bacterium]|nr:OmpA family protein [Polyangiaceae bacterium]
MRRPWLIRTPDGDFEARVAHLGASPADRTASDRASAWFSADFSLANGEPDALSSVQELRRVVTGSQGSFLGDREDVFAIAELRRWLEQAWRTGRVVFTPIARPVIRVLRSAAPAVEFAPPPASTDSSAPTYFEVRFVDEIGEAIAGLEVIITTEGKGNPVTTDGDGVARLDGVTSSFANVRVASISKLGEIVEPRWSTVRAGDPPTAAHLTRATLATLPSGIALESEQQHLVVIEPRRGKLFMELWDKAGRVRHVGCRYRISGPTSFDGETDENGRLLHEDVPPGDYELTLTVEVELAGEVTSNDYQSPAVVLDGTEAEPHIRRLGVVPRVIMARVRGLLFDLNKSFLLPSAIPALRRIRDVYATNNPSELLIVGHTDTSGEPNINDPLSVERADTVAAFLKDDVDPWLAWYGQGKPVSKRWGATEDLMMIQAMADYGTKPADLDPVSWFQKRHNNKPESHRQPMSSLKEDGILGPSTRRQLVSDYMGLDGATLGTENGLDIRITTHGCGENFPVDDTGTQLDSAPADDRRDQLDRRVELFFFDSEFGIVPPPPGKNSRAGSTAYPEWRKRAEQEHFFDVLDPMRLLRLRVLVQGEVHASAAYRLFIDGQLIGAGETNEDGYLVLPVPVDASEALLELPAVGLRRTVSLVASEGFPSVDTLEGQRTRLHQLGLYVGPLTGDADAAFSDAVERFRAERSLGPGTELDSAAQQELAATYGS